MKSYDVSVKQVMYEDFNKYDEAEIASVTEWSNGEGIDIFVQRKNLGNICLQLSWGDVKLFRRMFTEFD